MLEYDFKKEEVRTNILTNRHNHITTCYYLLLKSKIKKGTPSVADLISEDYRNYLADRKNLLINYNHDINLVVQERANSQKSKENLNKNTNDLISFQKENLKITADLSDMNSNVNFNIGKNLTIIILFEKFSF